MRRPNVAVGGVWPALVPPSSRRLSALDQYVSELGNFDDGGTWAPTGPVVIGGKGMELNSASDIFGGIVTKPKYGAADPRVELTDQWPAFDAPRSRIVSISWAGSEGSGPQPVFFRPTGALYQTGESQDNGLNVGLILDGPTLHDGATLTRARFTFRYTGQKPTVLLNETVQIVRYRRSDNGIDPGMHTAGTSGGITYGSLGTAGRDISTVEALYNGGNVIHVDYVPNQNNVIAKSTHYYGFGFFSQLRTEAIGLSLEYSVPDQRFE